MLTLHWSEDSAFGPSLELLCQVGDMGQARELARLAGTDTMPTKDDRLPATHPLTLIAAEHPGELLWRAPAAASTRVAQPPSDQWQVGAAGALALRTADVASYNAIRDAARDRRRSR